MPSPKRTRDLRNKRPMSTKFGKANRRPGVVSATKTKKGRKK